jgi:ABC-2 type transport system permease protein
MSALGTAASAGTTWAQSPSLSRMLRAERLRMFSTRGTWILIMLGLAMPGVFTWTFLLSIGKPGGVLLADPSAVATVLSAGSSSALMASLLGILSVTTEYRHGTAAVSTALVGRRTMWALPKLIVSSAAGLLVTVLGQAVVLAIGIPGLHSHGVTVHIMDGSVLWPSLGTASLGLFGAIFGVGFGLAVRNQLAAVVSLVVYTTMAEAAFLHFVPSVGRYLIGGANAAIAQDPTLQQLVSVPVGYLLLVGWSTIALAIGYRRLIAEDIPVD